jgi:acylphosphatase
MKVRKRVLVSGRVQGVFYRDTCRRIAAENAVSGWAKNRPDGRVEMALEGEADAVNRVVAWAQQGTDWAEVTDVEVTDEELRGESGFSVE